MILGILKRVINRKFLFIVFCITFVVGTLFLVLGTFSIDENLPIPIQFPTSSRYTIELNSFFNRTVVTAREDAQNKLLEDYWVRGYVILPRTPKPSAGYPVIIWMHGFGACAELQINYARQFAKSGFIAIAISQPGHGWSSGLWDMGIQAIAGVYSTVDWLVNSSPYKSIIDTTRIGVSGHSMGGIVTTRSGIFDNWTNPNTGRKIGTGGLIRSYCAIYCWDDLSTMAGGLMSDLLGVSDVWNHPVILNLLNYWRWLSNYDSSILEEEVRIRSVSNYINNSNIPNFCLVTGSLDELTTIEAQSYLMANSTINSSGTPEVSWQSIYDTVIHAPNHAWNYGTISNGSARRFVLVPGIEHLMEAFSYTCLQTTVTWFDESMECVGIDSNVSILANVPFLIKMIGWALILLGAIGCILPLFSYLSTSRLGPKPILPSKVMNQGFVQKKKILLYIAVPAVSISLSGLIQLPSLTHFWIVDLLIPRFFISGIVLLPFSIILCYIEVKRYGFKSQDIGINGTISNNLKSLLIPVLAILACVFVFDLVGWLFQVPILLPRPFDSMAWIDFIFLFGVFFLLNFGIELIFRGLFQSKIEKTNARKLKQWKTVLISGALSGVSIGIGFGFNLLFMIGGLFLSAPHLMIAIFGGLIFLFFLTGIASAYIYQRTRNILSTTIFNALLMTLFIAGKLFMPYA
ncbi:MAG: alpha/beta hydrolase family protein [Candidatus Helarchaeota archaeon]